MSYEPEWIAKRNCSLATAELFFENPGSDAAQVADAMAICGNCRVSQQCLEYAIINREREGIWGGTTPGQRRKMWSGRS